MAMQKISNNYMNNHSTKPDWCAKVDTGQIVLRNSTHKVLMNSIKRCAHDHWQTDTGK
jgi:hypothetical protein